MLETYGFEDGRVVQRSEGAQILVFTAPTEGERARLAGELGVDEHDLRSALEPLLA